MRKTIAAQLGLVPQIVDHPHSRELARVSEILDKLPVAAELVTKDLATGTKATKAGRAGMSGEQVLRAGMLKQMHSWSYEDLAFHLSDSPTFRTFCRIGMMQSAPKRSALAENIKRVRPETFERVNQLLIVRARRAGVENGKKVRVDSTVIDANIHHPLDNRLLYDVVRVLTRLMKKAQRWTGLLYSDHTKRAKRRMLDIVNARSMAHRVPVYRELVKITQWTLEYAADAAQRLNKLSDMRAWATAGVLEHYIELGTKVVGQTERRVFRDEPVPAGEKLVSIFEPHSDVIVKDSRQTLYGHKVFLSVGASGMILDLLMERGNPADATKAIPMLERHRSLMGRAPEQAAFDAGFTSTANIALARKLGVKDASFARKGSIDVLPGARSPQQHKKLLQRFRAGVEGIISFTKRCFGFDRCTWRGYRSFHAYAWASVLSTNLLLMARKTMT